MIVMLANPINLLGCISAWMVGLVILPVRNCSICLVSQNTCQGDDVVSFSHKSWKILLTLIVAGIDCDVLDLFDVFCVHNRIAIVLREQTHVQLIEQ